MTAKLEDAPDDTRLLQFRKADGRILLAVWRAAPCWRPSELAGIDVTPEQITLRLDGGLADAEAMTPNNGEMWEEIPRDGSSVRVNVGCKAVLVRLKEG